MDPPDVFISLLSVLTGKNEGEGKDEQPSSLSGSAQDSFSLNSKQTSGVLIKDVFSMLL